MVSTATRELITTASILWKLDPDVLLAIIEVESGGKTHVKINGRREPVIRFDGHLFHRHLPVAEQETAIRERLASPEAGGVACPVTQVARWRMLNRAAQIHRKAAYEATFWGIGQVPGAHWSSLGFSSVDALVKEARSGADGQLSLMMSYIEKAGLLEPLRERDWAKFAQGYRSQSEATKTYRQDLALAYRHLAKTGKAQAARTKVSDSSAPDRAREPDDSANINSFEGLGSLAQRVLRMITIRRDG
jgi:hypothetical protein